MTPTQSPASPLPAAPTLQATPPGALTPQLNTQQLKENIDALQKSGLTTDKIQAYVNNYKSDGKGGYTLSNPTQSGQPTPSSPPNALVKGATDLASNISQDTQGHAANIVQDLSHKPNLTGALDVAGNVAGEAGDFLGEPINAAASAVLTPQAKQALMSSVKSITGTPAAKGVLAAWNALQAQHPDFAKNIGNIVNIAALFGGDATASKAGLPTAEESIQAAKDSIPTVADSLNKGIDSPVAGVKHLVTKSPETLAANKDAFIKDLITPQMTTKDLTGAIKTGKVTEGTGLLGNRDVTTAVPGFDNMQKAVSEVPGLKAGNTALENSNAIHDHIGTLAQSLKSQLADVQNQVGRNRGFFTPNEFKGYMSGVKTTLSENPLIVGDAEKTATKILDKFSSLINKNGYTPSGLLNARQELDNWMTMQKGQNVFDPKTESAVSIALRAVRQGGNDFLASKVPSVPVKQLLSKQTSLYNAIENIAPKAAKEGANGFQQFVKAHPTLIKVAKYGAPLVGAGVLGRELLP